MDYKYADGDNLVFTGEFIQKSLNANKTIWIEREIGKYPVLAFRNSGSDMSMMNYLGRVLDQQFNGDFLKEALRKADKKMPYRGPEYYQSGEYTYKCSVTGEFSWFQGYEEIYCNNVKVYECYFHGGIIR